jgi:signal transduction histidine kinase
VRIEFVKPAPPLAVMADPAQLQQVLINLVANAVHAIGDNKGAVTITLEATQHEHSDAASIIVGDTGCGMTQAVLDRIFEPFFTTKPPGEGTGLGLSVVHGIVANHGGIIRATSQPGHGTRFDIILPQAEPEQLAGAA